MKNLKKRNTEKQRKRAIATLWQKLAAGKKTRTMILGELANIYGVDEKTIGRWEMKYLNPPQPNRPFRFKRLDTLKRRGQLMEKLMVLISCTEDPRLETTRDTRTYPLQLYDEDWRLM